MRCASKTEEEILKHLFKNSYAPHRAGGARVVAQIRKVPSHELSHSSSSPSLQVPMLYGFPFRVFFFFCWWLVHFHFGKESPKSRTHLRFRTAAGQTLKFEFNDSNCWVKNDTLIEFHHQTHVNSLHYMFSFYFHTSFIKGCTLFLQVHEMDRLKKVEGCVTSSEATWL